MRNSSPQTRRKARKGIIFLKDGSILQIEPDILNRAIGFK